MRPLMAMALAVGCQAWLGLTAHAVTAAAAPGPGQTPQWHVGEIFGGTTASPHAQYVVLRSQGASAANANNALGYGFVALDASGSKAPLGYLWLDHNVDVSAAGAPILIATPEAAAFFAVTPDFVWSAPDMPQEGALCVLRPGGGYDDCVLFGSKQPNSLTQLDPNVTNRPFNESGGIPLGKSAQRIGITADSSRDFMLSTRLWPQNNAGAVGQVPAARCGDGAIDGLEACDAGAACGAVGGSCTSTCAINPQGAGAVCGNGVVDAGESCDDFNTVDLDGCSSSCQWEPIRLHQAPVCGNGRLEAGEACDAGALNGQGQAPCSSTCTQVTGLALQPWTCGNGAVESPFVWPFAQSRAEQCDLGAQNGAAQSPCSASCQFAAAHHSLAVCGNGTVEPGELCDDGNTEDHDGCAADCSLETHAYFVCGDGVLQVGEACDHGPANGVLGDACSSICTLVPAPLARVQPGAVAPASAGSTSWTGGGQGPLSAAVRGGSCQAVAPDALAICACGPLLWRLGRMQRRRRNNKRV